MKTYSFSKFVRKSISERDTSIGKDIHLESMFVDKRDDFDTVIDKIRCISSNILSMLDYLATHYQFNYFLAYGTLIGAIRHKGFIPWDDDIDIMMTKEDLSQLIAVSHLFPKNLEIKVMGNNFVKVMDKNSKISLDGKRGVAVDIFVLDENKSELLFNNVHNQEWIITNKADWFPIKKHPFGEYHFNVPANYDDILTKIYGNYMKLPPVEQRVYQHIDLDKIIIESVNNE